MSAFEGFERRDFLFEDRKATVILPPEPKKGAAIAIKCEYQDAFPGTETELLKRGHYVTFIKNDDRWGRKEELERKARFVEFVAKEYGLAPRCIPVGMSCGGLIGIKFAAAFPDMVSALYADAPVVNYMSCPLGFGKSDPLDGSPDEILKALKISFEELLAYRDMPLDHIGDLVKSRIPLALVAGDSDSVVPFDENGIFLKQAYEKTDIPFFFKLKPGCDHHPHGLEDPAELADFLERFDG